MSARTRLAGWMMKRATNLAAVDLKSFFAAMLGSGGVQESLGGPEDAFRLIGTVYRCTITIAEQAAVGISLIDAKGQPVENKEARAWLDMPYPGMDYQQWLKRVIGQLVVTGGSRLLQVDPMNNIALMPVSLNECTVDGDANRFPPVGFWYLGNRYAPDRVISIQGPDPTQINDATGSVEAAALSLDAGFYARKHAASTIKGGAFLGAVMKYAREFPNEDAFKKFMAGWQESLRRAKQDGSFPLLQAGNDFTIEKLGLSFVDLALPAMIAGSDKEVAKAMGVPPAYLGEDSNSLANFEQQRRIFLETKLEGTWKTIESALNVGMQTRLPGFRAKFNRLECPIAQEVRQERGAKMAAQVHITLTPNDWRREMGLPAWPAEVGDVVARPVIEDRLPVPPPPAEGAPSRATRDIAEGFRAFAAAMAPKPVPAPAKTRLGRSEAERKAHGVAFDLLLGDYRADGKATRGLMGKYGREFDKLHGALKSALRDAAKTHWESEKRVPYDREMFDKNALALRMRLLPAVWRDGQVMGDKQVAAASGRAIRADRSALTEAAMRKLRERAERWTAETGDVTFTAIDETLQTAVNDGYTLQQVMDAIDGLDELGPVRAERISRTEVIGSLNGGAVESYGQSGEVESKEWLAVLDDRTRDAHVTADGQIVGLEESFDVDGERLAYPGDPDGDPGNIINCRCTVLPVLSKAGEEE